MPYFKVEILKSRYLTTLLSFEQPGQNQSKTYAICKQDQ